MKYTDPIDQASETELQNTAAAIALARAKIGPALPATGSCHNCAEPLPPGERFCDEHCRDDYEHIQRRREANRR